MGLLNETIFVFYQRTKSFQPKLALSLSLSLSHLNFLSTPYLAVIVQGLYLLYNDMTEKGCWFCSANVEKEIEKPLIRINITCAPMVKQASIHVEFLIRLQIIFSLYISHKLHASLSSWSLLVGHHQFIYFSERR